MRMSSRALGALLICCVLMLTTAMSVGAADRGESLALTDSGWVRGTVAGEYRLFQGIPFAAPPVGELRWRGPQPPRRWAGIRDATAPGPRCAQVAALGYPASDAEDCLYLNVTTPRAANRRPVLVWVHGGGLMSGAGSDYDARRLAVSGNLVVVTLNYRLGNFGFFGHPGILDGGAFGIEDQQAALRWVQRNIALFGGDPRNVTVAGESAGAHSVCAQLASPRAAGLFHRAIGQSTACADNVFDAAGFTPLLDLPLFVPPQWHHDHSAALAARFGCADVACLHVVPAPALRDAPALLLPSYGNTVLPQDPKQTFLAGRHHRVPLLTGTTRDEGTLFAPLLFAHITPDNYAAWLNTHFGADGPAVAAQYPLRDHGGSAIQAVAAIMSDLDWAWPQRDADRRFAARMPTYVYEFTDRTAPPIPGFPPGLEPLASHGAELRFLFDLPADHTQLTPQQHTLAHTMVAYWSRFATTGNPNGPDLPAWHPATPSQPEPYVQRLDLGPHNIGPFDRATTHRLPFWDDLKHNA